ncbi:Endoribonuclease L-PSP, partial [Saccharata proteae CBS 121410]
KETVVTDKTPLPFKPTPFAAAVKCNGMVYVSGSLGMDAKTEKMIEGTVYDRTNKVALTNLSGVLEDAGTSLQNIVKANVYLKDMADFSEMNRAYMEFFPGDYIPARTCVQVAGLPLGTDVEIECTAHL